MIRLILAILLTLCLASPSWAAVAFDSSGTATANASTTPYTISGVTVGGGANECLFFSFAQATGQTITSILWNTTEALTEFATFTSGSRVLKVWILCAPTSGNKSLVAIWTGGGTMVGALASFSGVDQTTPIITADTQSANATSTSATLTIPSATGDATISFDHNTSGNFSAQTQTVIANLTAGSTRDDLTYALDGSSNVHTSTLASAIWTAIGVHINQSGGAPVVTPLQSSPGFLGAIIK